MVKSSSDVFGLRQSLSDLRAYLRGAGRPVRARLAGSMRSAEGAEERLAQIDRVIDEQGARFQMPGDVDVQEVVRLAAALPSDDYPAFTFSTAFLLADRLQSVGSDDDLYWNWESFRAEYALADPPVRAALMNAFRFGAVSGRVQINGHPKPDDCLTHSREEVRKFLESSGRVDLLAFLLGDPDADDAGDAWMKAGGAPLQREDALAFRYLYERPVSFAPARAGDAPLLPWSVA